MLKSLSVKNYALIRDLHLSPDSGLLIITGETGAGKSILLGALGLVLGERAESNVVEGQENKCVVEGVFDISAYGLESFFTENELDFESPCILRREISIQGKSRAFINDTPVTLAQLKELGENLIDIHSQHETLSLKDRRYQVQLLDTFAGNEGILQNYRMALHHEKALRKELNELIKQEAEWRAEYDYNSFLLHELKEAHLKGGEEAELEEQQRLLEHASEIVKTAFDGAESLRNGDDSAHARLKDLENALRQQSANDPRFISLFERVKSLVIEVDDIASELEKIADTTVSDNSLLEQIAERIDLLFALQKKHRLDSSEQLIAKQFELEDKTAKVESIEEEKSKLQKRCEESGKELEHQIALLRQARNEALPKLLKKLKDLLAEAGMPHAQVEMRITAIELAGEDGPDQITMYFSSNPGALMQPLNKVASGGELSRVMLCFKSILAASRSLPTLIFDEIDTGISGEVAAKVGRMMKAMAKGHQVISITHLPQIAGFGNQHYLVYKEIEKGSTQTFMKHLNEEERVKELARMLSGDRLSDSALANARELLAQ